MGQPHITETIDNFLKSESNYNHFMSLYLHFQNTFIDDTIYIDKCLRKKYESNLAISLSLISNIHLHIMTRNMLLKDIINYPNIKTHLDLGNSIEHFKYRLQSNPFSQIHVKLIHNPILGNIFDYQSEHSIKGIVDCR